ncbi:type II secretion system protein [Shewanella sp. MMG014]|uniref:type II secretion system protein n=1 Tax=Shewanella sp. MMG014 TaxID=2822691 RepID=UPI001B35F340|nr:type II secretion system protein [Shewanella sp. MMG014]MBQ4889707.1 type II secretion system protein [Shewanella sp. MMG014]
MKIKKSGFALLEVIIAIGVVGIVVASLTISYIKLTQEKMVSVLANDLSNILISASNRISIGHEYPNYAALPWSAANFPTLSFTANDEFLSWVKYSDCENPVSTYGVPISLRPQSGGGDQLTQIQDLAVLPCWISETLIGGVNYSSKDEIFLITDYSSIDAGYELDLFIDLNDSSMFNSNENVKYFTLFQNEIESLIMKNQLVTVSSNIEFAGIDMSGTDVILNSDPHEILKFLEDKNSKLRIRIKGLLNVKNLLSDGSVLVNEEKALCWDSSNGNSSVVCLSNNDGNLNLTNKLTGDYADFEVNSLITNDHGERRTTPTVHFIRGGTQAVRKPSCPQNWEPHIASAISSFADGGGQQVSESDWGNTIDGGGINYEASSPIGIVATGWNSNVVNSDYWDVHSFLNSVETGSSGGMPDSSNVSLIAFTWCEPS